MFSGLLVVAKACFFERKGDRERWVINLRKRMFIESKRERERERELGYGTSKKACSLRERERWSMED